jgi:hypothetical protein
MNNITKLQMINNVIYLNDQLFEIKSWDDRDLTHYKWFDEASTEVVFERYLQNNETIYTDENNYLHNPNGPASISNSWKAWYHHGYLHRIDGPAVERLNEDNSYNFYYHGNYMNCRSTEDLQRLINLKSFL